MTLKANLLKGVVCLSVATACLVVNVRQYPMVGKLLSGEELQEVAYHHEKPPEGRESFISIASRWWTAAQNRFNKKTDGSTTEPSEKSDTPPDAADTATPPKKPSAPSPAPIPTSTPPPSPTPVPVSKDDMPAPPGIEVSQPTPAISSRYSEPVIPAKTTSHLSPTVLADGAWLPPAM